MTLEQFKASLTQSQPPSDLHPIVQGLWYDAKGDWEQAHNIAQGREGDQPYDRLHAYLHRKEGDRFNANYWYRRAKATFFDGSLEEEWRELVQQHL
ncbi:hypothetical protein [Spirosoma endophyticum]|uniref:Uncharacterized protein n=1 Tax=Spirosoma endophyticum TaxID=662367 RepID=A0A1I1MW49_9BACT|nr:hypothetical protein [Spirosoma endophyticum]SFC85780.1 hypothetical protein SAMN05216167_102607 [Spirosoma endophyticum]